MSKYLFPLLFFGAAAFVWNYNATHEQEYLLFPLLDLIPSLQGDLEAQAEWSWRVIAGIGGIMLLFAAVGDVRRAMVPKNRPVPKVEPDDEPPD